MKPSAADKPYVLDTSALLAYLKGESGAEVVERILDSGSDVAVSQITLMEVRYLYVRQAGADDADDALQLISQLGLEEITVSREVLMGAADIKARVHLSVADAVIAATAMALGAHLVHRDPEFGPLSDEVDLLPLPKKA